MLYLGADHRGYNLKEGIKNYLQEEDIPFKDLGNTVYDDKDDYPDWAEVVAQRVSSSAKKDKGILICGSGIGMSIVANKFPKIRAGLCLSGYMAKSAKEDDDVNIICLAADITDLGTSQRIIEEWQKAKFKKDNRYQRRVNKIRKIEQKIKE